VLSGTKKAQLSLGEIVAEITGVCTFEGETKGKPASILIDVISAAFTMMQKNMR